MAIIEIYDTTFSATTVLRALNFDRARAERLARDCTILSIFQDSSSLFLSRMSWGGSSIGIQFRIKEQSGRYRYHIHGACSCGAANCLHAEVVLLALEFRELAADLQSGNYRDFPVGKSGLPGLSASSMALLKALHESRSPGSGVSPLNASRKTGSFLLYNLYRESLGLTYAKRLKNGLYAKNSHTHDCSWELISRRCIAVKDRDLPFFELEDCDRAVFRFLWTQMERLPDEDHVQLSDIANLPLLFELLTATGRLVVQHEDSRTHLKLGPRLHAKLAWNNDRDTWRLKPAFIDAHDAQALNTIEPWYADLELETTGPYDLGEQQDLYPLMRMKLAIPEADLPALAAELCSFSHSLPRLPNVRVTDLGVVRPTPRLDLKSRTVSGSPDTVLATLSFEYEGHRFSRASRNDDARLVIAQGSSQILIQRDLRFEQSCDVRLRTDCGLVPFQSDYIVASDRADWNPSRHLDFLDTLFNFQTLSLPALIADGWKVHMPDDLPRLLPVSDPWVMDFAESSAQGWYNVAMEVTVDGTRINMVALLRILLADPAFVQWFRSCEDDEEEWLTDIGANRWLPIPIADIRPLARLLIDINGRDNHGPVCISKFDVSVLEAGASGKVLIKGADQLFSLQQQLARSPAPFSQALLPEALLPLRPYQLEGVAWLRSRMDAGVGVVLADHMAVGKTVQALSHIWAYRNEANDNPPSLVVLPPTLLSKWKEEQEKFFPTMKVAVYHGQQREPLAETHATNDAVLTSYSLLANELDLFSQLSWHIMVMDEGHELRNRQTAKAKACRALAAGQKVLLTGTPLQNSLGDLWSVMDIVTPGIFRDYGWFKERFLPKGKAEGQSLGLAGLAGRISSPFLLKRSNEDVGNQLPELNVVNLSIDLHDTQSRIYETIRASMDAEVRQTIQASGVARSQITVLSAITRLRQVCCHPALLKSDAIGKHVASAKMDHVLSMIDELTAEGKKTVVALEWTGMLNILAAELDRKKIAYRVMDGSLSVKKRIDNLNEFRRSPDIPVLLMTLTVGGTGIDIPEGDAIIIYSPWWNPERVKQVIARLRREANDKIVTAYALIAKGTLEEAIVEMGERKAAIFNAVMDGSTSASLSLEDIHELFRRRQ